MSESVVSESVETLADLIAMHDAYHVNEDGWTVCICGHVAVDDDDDGSHARHVADVIASGAVRPAAEVRAEAWDEGYRAAMTASIGMQGRPNQGASFPADWPDHNPHRAALAEEGGDRG